MFTIVTIVSRKECQLLFIATIFFIVFMNNFSIAASIESEFTTHFTYPIIACSSNTRRIDVIKKAIAIEALHKAKNSGPISYRKVEDSTGIDHSTLYDWDQGILKKIEILKKQMPHLNEHYAEEIVMIFSSPVGRYILDLIFISAEKNFIVSGRAGSDTVSKFFHDCSLHLFMSVSPRYLRDQAKKMQDDILEYKAIEVKRLVANKSQSVIAPLSDETWIGGEMILATIDAISNYTIVEQKSKLRTAAVWKDFVKKEADDLKCDIITMGSDQGTGVVSMGKKFDIARFTDLFHINNEIFKGFILELGRMIKNTTEEFRNANEHLKNIIDEKVKAESTSLPIGRPINWEARLIDAKRELNESENLLRKILDVRSQLLEIVHNMNDCYHLVGIETGVIKTGKIVVTGMIAEIEIIREMAQIIGISEQVLSQHLDKAIRVM